MTIIVSAQDSKDKKKGASMPRIGAKLKPLSVEHYYCDFSFTVGKYGHTGKLHSGYAFSVPKYLHVAFFFCR